jgi:hypothetical protein
MVKKADDDPDVPEPWTPDKPLPDEEDETQTQRRFMAERRLKFLHDQAEEPEGKKKKKKDGDKPKLW